MTKRERILAVIEGRKVDKIPAAFWYHYPMNCEMEEQIEGQLKLYHDTDMDLIKIMHEFRCSIETDIVNASDWKKVKMCGAESPLVRRQIEIIQKVRGAVGTDVMIFATVFGPLQMASWQVTDSVLMSHCQENFQAVSEGMKIMGDILSECTQAYLEAGADGIYYSAQYGEQGRFSREQWEQIVKQSDLKILQIAHKKDRKYTILHLCGEERYQAKINLDWYADYPGDIVNWSVKDNHFSLQEGRKLFNRPILGGMNNKGNLITGTFESIQSEARAVLMEAGEYGFVLGADCTVKQPVDLKRIAVAVKTAHDYL